MASSGFNSLSAVTLVLGGARSGKSRYAEDLILAALQPGGGAVYLATAQAGDAEMAARIQLHRKRRGRAWRTVEEPLDLPGPLARPPPPGSPGLVHRLPL